MIVDAGPLIAVADADDADHKRCVGLMARHRGERYVPAPVVTEVCWLLERERGSEAEAGFLDSLATGELTLVNLTSSDLRRMAELVRRYQNLPLGAADASVVAIAERLGIVQIAPWTDDISALCDRRTHPCSSYSLSLGVS